MPNNIHQKSEVIENLLKTSKIKTISMRRIEMMGHRGYSTIDVVKLYSGLTGALDTVTFKGNADNKRLTGWRNNFIDTFGKANQDAYVQMTADFGTLCHTALLNIWVERKLNWENEQSAARIFFRNSAISNGQIPNERIIEQQVFEYCKAAAALMYFVNKEVSEIYAIEAMCKTEEHLIATPIDIVCKLKNGKVATINLKTSAQLNDKHREQVIMEKFMWNETYPDNKADVTCLLRPKDWSMKKGEPTYEFEVVNEDSNHTLNIILQKLRLSRLSDSDTYLRFPKDKVEFAGETALGEAPKMKTTPFEQYLGQLYSEDLELV